MSVQKPVWQLWWHKIGLSPDVAKAVIKNTLPSTAALWIIQSARINQQFDTVGFLPIIITILTVPSQPRIPFLRFIVYTIFLQCIALCVTLLAGWCATQARIHTTAPGGNANAYNSSAAAVSAVWLIFAIWALQTFRTFQPHRAKSVIQATILTEIAIVTSCHLPDMASIISFQTQLFEMFLLGYAFSTFSSLFIFPQTSRSVTLADISKIFDLSGRATSLEQPFGTLISSKPTDTPDTAAHRHVTALSRTFAKFEIDVSDAKRDIGWSRFSPGHYKDLVHQFRLLIIPLRGIFAVESIRSSLHFGYYRDEFDEENALEDPVTVDSKERWDAIFDRLQSPMSQLNQLTHDAIGHCRIAMHLPGSNQPDGTNAEQDTSTEDHGSEKVAQNLPGGAGFVADFEGRINQQRDAMKLVLMSLKDEEGPFGSVENVDGSKPSRKQHAPSASQGRLLFTLYVEHLYNEVLAALLELVLYCDTTYMGTKKKLQLPGKRRFLKLSRRLVEHQHVEGDMDDLSSEIPSLMPQRSRAPERRFSVSVPVSRRQALERVNDFFRKPFEIIGSRQSFFGFRVACAVMTIAIVAFLGQTQQWFFNRRGIWAAVFIPFSMAPSSGEAKSMLLYRVLGSMLSIVIAIVNWYIVDGVPAGIIVFFLVFNSIQQYFLVKLPQYGSFWRPCTITHAIIVGYSLQAKYDHTPQPPANTADSFPVYEIGPYRGLCTIIGVAVAYFWTIFPQPTTANSVMRQRVGQSLFTLAEYHSCMHWAISSWASGHQGDMKDKKSVSHQLMKIRHKLFVKEAAILAVIRDQDRFAGFDITLLGASPEHRYVTIADEVDRIMTYLNVVILVSIHFRSHLDETSTGTKRRGPWESGVNDLLIACKSTSRQIASLIHILASSVINNQPLPPFLESPESFAVARKLRQMRPDLMDVQHADEEGYKCFAVIEVSVAMVTKSLDRILILVKDLVGEIGIDADSITPKT